MALADYLAGLVSSSTIAVGNPERFVRVNAFSLFWGDTWQLDKKLSVNLGLRYEYFGPLHSANKDIANFIPGKGLLIQGAGLDSVFQPDRNNIAPRIGFAYQPTAKGDLVLRGGAGVFYDQINMNPFLDFRPPITAAGLPLLQHRAFKVTRSKLPERRPPFPLTPGIPTIGRLSRPVALFPSSPA